MPRRAAAASRSSRSCPRCRRRCAAAVPPAEARCWGRLGVTVPPLLELELLELELLLELVLEELIAAPHSLKP